MELRTHDIRLADGELVLRPMTEGDWGIILPWHMEPEVLYYSEGDQVTTRTLAEVQMIYRGVAEHAFNFIAEVEGRPIGDCWLQEMNLERVLSRYPRNLDLRRIDLEIGDKTLWGCGLGTRMIALLVEFGFEVEHADAIFGCCIGDYNQRSRRAFEKNGFVIDEVIAQPDGGKAKEVYDMVLRREGYDGLRK